MEAVFLEPESNSTRGNDFNPDCEQDDGTYLQADHAEADSAETSSPSKKRTGKKRDYSKKSALTKAGRQRLCEILYVTDLKVLWHQITCKLNECFVLAESNPDSETVSESSLENLSVWIL